MDEDDERGGGGASMKVGEVPGRAGGRCEAGSSESLGHRCGNVVCFLM